MLRLYNFIEARERMRTVTNDTKIIYSEVFSEETGHEVYIKPENLQRTGSFKLRGAYNKIMKLSDEEKKRGVIASSAGNHAQGVAYAAQQLGIKSVIVMPKDAPLIKVDATKNYGAEVVLHGDVYDDAYNKACELQEKEGYVFVHPFDDKDVIEGQGSIGLEILDEINDVDIILVPIGGGGLISGIASAVKQMNPNIKIVGVEPEGAASALAALNCGDVLELSDCNTIADGTAVKRIGNLPFKYIRQYVDEIVTVSDYDLMEPFFILVERHKLIVENSGILSLAALKKLKEKNKKVVSILSGGNIDVRTISSMINKGLVARGRIFKFVVYLPDKPGQLVQVAEILAELNANVVRLDHDQFVNLDRFHDVELQVTVETNGEEHIQRITETMLERGFKITRLNINF
ncbi:MAG: threonine ammonia-lyase [Tissierellia bacterium]|nr:threonine ammonia-lyase [Tissierellia bacterium]